MLGRTYLWRDTAHQGKDSLGESKHNDSKLQGGICLESSRTARRTQGGRQHGLHGGYDALSPVQVIVKYGVLLPSFLLYGCHHLLWPSAESECSAPSHRTLCLCLLSLVLCELSGLTQSDSPQGGLLESCLDKQPLLLCHPPGTCLPATCSL